jgi:hypothetical protein
MKAHHAANPENGVVFVFVVTVVRIDARAYCRAVVRGLFGFSSAAVSKRVSGTCR